MNYIITGGGSGMGLELTKKLLKEGHHIGLIVRNEQRKDETIDELGTDKLDFFFADLSDQSAVRQVASNIKAKWDHLDGLFNNAGVLLDKEYASKQDNEMHFEVNTLSPYLLTTELKPLLEAAENPFVVNTLTGGLHKRKLEVDSLKKPKKFVKLMGPYMHSKTALLLLMNNLSEKWPNVRIAGADPGPNKTKMTAGDGMPGWLLPIRNLLFPKPTKGAGKIYQTAFDSKFIDKTGIYVSGGKVVPVKPLLSEGEIDKILSNIN
ncbi:MAG: SDR family NAD(P)-dependent oxidoreductase [Bacteroidota bacterium]